MQLTTSLSGFAVYVLPLLPLLFSGLAEAYCKQPHGILIEQEFRCSRNCIRGSCGGSPCHHITIYHNDNTFTGYGPIAGDPSFENWASQQVHEFTYHGRYADDNTGPNGFGVYPTSCSWAPWVNGMGCQSRAVRVHKSSTGVDYGCGNTYGAGRVGGNSTETEEVVESVEGEDGEDGEVVEEVEGIAGRRFTV